jgi:lysophospholipase L1-like esterase
MKDATTARPGTGESGADTASISHSDAAGEAGADSGYDEVSTPAADSGSGAEGGSDSSFDAGFDSSFDSGAHSRFDAAPTLDSGADGKSSGASDAGKDTGRIAHEGPWRITFLGDSITGEMCPPQLLSQQLIQNGYTDFTFVGTNLNDQSCYGAPNVYTEGHGGYLVTDLVGSGIHAAELPQWCATDRADIVLMQFGTNDVWNGKPTASILAAYSVVLADLRAVNPAVALFIAQITPLNPVGCTTCEAGVVALNAQIPAWASSQSTAASPVYVVDVFAAFDPATYIPNSTDTTDGVHPTPAGSKLDAEKWYEALVAQGLP